MVKYYRCDEILAGLHEKVLSCRISYAYRVVLITGTQRGENARAISTPLTYSSTFSDTVTGIMMKETGNVY